MSWRRGGHILLLLVPGLGLILALIGAVLYMAVAQSLGFFNFSGESGLTTQYWRDEFGERQLWRAFLYSLRIATLGAVGAVLLAYPLALWLRKPFPGSLAIGAILKAPLLVHGLVAAFLFVNVISFHGFFNELMVWIGIIDRPIRMQNDRYGNGVVFLQIWKQMPFALLLLTGAVQAIGDDILDAGRDLGAGSFDRFRKIVAPLTLKAMQASLIIIFIGAAGDYSFQVVAGPTSENSMAQFMYRTQTEFGGWNPAAVIAVMLMALALFGSIVLAGVAKLAVRGARI